MGLYAALLDELRDAATANRFDYMVTFDDGNRSDIDVALRPLLDRQMQATFFPCAGRLHDRRFLDQCALRELVASGMRVGSHGWAHTDWRKASDATLHREVHDAKERLEQAADTQVSEVAIPFGSYDRRVIREARLFEHIYTSDAALAETTNQLRPRFSYTTGWSPGSIERLARTWRKPTRRLMKAAAMTIKRYR